MLSKWRSRPASADYKQAILGSLLILERLRRLSPQQKAIHLQGIVSEDADRLEQVETVKAAAALGVLKCLPYELPSVKASVKLIGIASTEQSSTIKVSCKGEARWETQTLRSCLVLNQIHPQSSPSHVQFSGLSESLPASQTLTIRLLFLTEWLIYCQGS